MLQRGQINKAAKYTLSVKVCTKYELGGFRTQDNTRHNVDIF
jgi:hypothetical protein